MRTLKAWKTVERWPSGHYNLHRNVLVKVGHKEYELEIGPGSTDRVKVFREGPDFYVLVVNSSMGYVGLTHHVVPDIKAEDASAPVTPSHDVFLQYDHEIADVLGKSGLDLSPLAMVKRIAEYMY